MSDVFFLILFYYPLPLLLFSLCSAHFVRTKLFLRVSFSSSKADYRAVLAAAALAKERHHHRRLSSSTTTTTTGTSADGSNLSQSKRTGKKGAINFASSSCAAKAFFIVFRDKRYFPDTHRFSHTHTLANKKEKTFTFSALVVLFLNAHCFEEKGKRYLLVSIRQTDLR